MRVWRPAALAFVCALQIQIPGLAEQTPPTLRVGVERGTVILASAQTPEILTRFIDRAGGPDSAIVFVPTASRQKPGAPEQFYEETGTGSDLRPITLRPGEQYDLAARAIRRADGRQ